MNWASMFKTNLRMGKPGFDCLSMGLFSRAQRHHSRRSALLPTTKQFMYHLHLPAAPLLVFLSV